MCRGRSSGSPQRTCLQKYANQQIDDELLKQNTAELKKARKTATTKVDLVQTQRATTNLPISGTNQQALTADARAGRVGAVGVRAAAAVEDQALRRWKTQDQFQRGQAISDETNKEREHNDMHGGALREEQSRQRNDGALPR